MSVQVKLDQRKCWPLIIGRSIETPTGDSEKLYYRLDLPFLPFIGLNLHEPSHEIKTLVWVQEDGQFWSYDTIITERPLDEIVAQHKVDGWQAPVEVNERTGELGLLHHISTRHSANKGNMEPC